MTSPTDAGSRALTPGELRQVYQFLRTWRDRALFGVMALTGIRIGEVCALNVGDVFRPDGQVRQALRIRSTVKRDGSIGCSKGKKARDVPTSVDLVELLRMHWRDLDDRSEGAPLLQSRQRSGGGRRLSTRQARRVLGSAFELASMERATSHSLRHSLALWADREGISVRVIRSLLGHSSLASTNEYLRHVAEWEKRSAVEALRFPLVGLVPARTEGE